MNLVDASPPSHWMHLSQDPTDHLAWKKSNTIVPVKNKGTKQVWLRQRMNKDVFLTETQITIRKLKQLG